MTKTQKLFAAILVLGIGVFVFRSTTKPAPASNPQDVKPQNTPDSSDTSGPSASMPSSSTSPMSVDKVREPASTAAAPLKSLEEQAITDLQTISQKKWVVARGLKDSIRTLKAGSTLLLGESERERSQNFLKQYGAKLFHVDAADLKESAVLDTDRVIVRYQQMFEGLPVYASTVALVFEDLNLVRVQNDLNGLPKLAANATAQTQEQITNWVSEGVRKEGLEQSKNLTSQIESVKPVYIPSPAGLVMGYEVVVERFENGELLDAKKLVVDASEPRIYLSINLHQN